MSSYLMNFRQDSLNIIISLIIFSIPFAGYSVPTGILNLSVTNFLIILATGWLCINVLSNGILELTRKQIVIIAMLLGVIVTASVSTLINQGNFRFIVTQIGHLLLVGVLFISVSSITEGLKLLKIWFVSAITISILAIISSLTGIDLGSGFYSTRTIGPINLFFRRTVGIPLSMGEYGMYVLAVTPYFALVGFFRKRYTYLGGVLLVVFTVLFITQSRSTWLAMGLAFGTIFFLLPQMLQSKRLMRFYKMALVPMTGFLIIGGPALIRIIINIQPRTVMTRYKQMVGSFRIMLEKPILGTGLVRSYGSFPGEMIPHNAFIRTGVTTGLLGFLLMIIIYAVAILHFSRWVANSDSLNEAALAIGLLAGFVAIVTEVMFLPGFGKTSWAFLAIFISLSFQMKNSF